MLRADGRRLSFAWRHIAFALTGIGTTLFGCALPGLSRVWHLDDRQAGIIFAAQFTGSSLGALLVQSDFFRSALRGLFVLIICGMLVALSAAVIRPWMFFTFGLGLGLTMTAISMLTGKVNSANRGSALSLLNVAWGLGAAASPFIASVWVERWSPPNVFFALTGALTLTFLRVVSNQRPFALDGDAVVLQPISHKERRLLVLLALISFLYVGTEAAVSGWMVTYVHRLPIAGNASALAASCFWMALLLGRMLVPAISRFLSEAQLLTSSLLGGFIGIVLLLASHTPYNVVASAAITGLALGPIFPLCLGRVLALTHDSTESKWVFCFSGLGGAVLPAITGEISARSGSLRSGLLVAVFALGTMLLLDWFGSDRRLASQEILRHP